MQVLLLCHDSNLIWIVDFSLLVSISVTWLSSGLWLKDAPLDLIMGTIFWHFINEKINWIAMKLPVPKISSVGGRMQKILPQLMTENLLSDKTHKTWETCLSVKEKKKKISMRFLFLSLNGWIPGQSRVLLQHSLNCLFKIEIHCWKKTLDSFPPSIWGASLLWSSDPWFRAWITKESSKVGEWQKLKKTFFY